MSHRPVASRPNKQSLGFFPTPLASLPRFSAFLSPGVSSESSSGPSIWVKRDDQTGLALGGNKTRKLEYLVGDALARGADTLITAGAAQSNHCRQTAAAAAKCGLECHLVLGGQAPAQVDGNLLLDQLCGAHIHWAGAYRKGETIPALMDELTQAGKHPYVIPYGGSNAIGALGFVEAVAELKQQLIDTEQSFSHIVFASASGGTHAGLMVGCALHQLDVELIGIAIDKDSGSQQPFEQLVADLATETAGLVEQQHHYSPDDVQLIRGFTGEGYGVVSDLERQAISTLAHAEGILVDPVYTGRALGALMSLIDQGHFTPDDKILFWHTGGAPALFAYAPALTHS